MLGMVFCWMDRLMMSARAPIAIGASCFRCLFEMPSGPTEKVVFVCSIACFVVLEMKGGGDRIGGTACVGLCLFSCRHGSVIISRWMRSAY